MEGLLNFLVKLSPVGAVVIAFMGLDTWKRQIKGTDKYKVASELLTSIYRVREGVKVVRSSFIEYTPVKKKDDDDREAAEFNGFAEEMDRRWKNISEPLAEVSLLTLKAEVHLDKDIPDLVGQLVKKVRELQVNLQMYLDHKRPGSEFEFEREWRKVLWAKPSNDEFAASVEEAIKAIENKVRPFI